MDHFQKCSRGQDEDITVLAELQDAAIAGDEVLCLALKSAVQDAVVLRAELSKGRLWWGIDNSAGGTEEAG